ncbi:MAG: pyridoxine 5'-phosphate synthase, partial [Mucinivorans sp.]
AKVVTTEFNIEGYPTTDFVDLVMEVCPAQVTLVPDSPDAITSNAGWDTVANVGLLKKLAEKFHTKGIRVSIFVEPCPKMIRAAVATGTDRVELYTESYAKGYAANRSEAIAPFVQAAAVAVECGLGVNAGHDLSLENLAYFATQIPALKEVSIGHALICDALYLGLENTVQLYRRGLEK